MSKCMIAAAVLVAMGAAVSFAEGLPSQSKLAKMGLSSMSVVDDHAGTQVRGKGFGAGYFAFAVAVVDPLNVGAAATSTFVGAYTFGQDPRAAAGDLVTGTGGIDPIAPGSPLTVNLATPNGVWTASTFGIAFGAGN
jgi:hypothetical protein